MMYTSEVTSQITANKSACMKNKVSKKKHLKIHIVSSFTAPGTTNSLPLKKKKSTQKNLCYNILYRVNYHLTHSMMMNYLATVTLFHFALSASQTPRTHKVLESAAL